jgi:hypothetical protein
MARIIFEAAASSSMMEFMICAGINTGKGATEAEAA